MIWDHARPECGQHTAADYKSFQPPSELLREWNSGNVAEMLDVLQLRDSSVERFLASHGALDRDDLERESSVYHFTHELPYRMAATRLLCLLGPSRFGTRA